MPSAGLPRGRSAARPSPGVETTPPVPGLRLPLRLHLPLAVAALLLGALFYWAGRPGASAAFLALLPASPFADWMGWSHGLGWLPSFLHVFAFSLLTWVALGRRQPALACAIWLVTNVVFELAQGLPLAVIEQLPDIFNLRAALRAGVPDPLDLFACVLGAVTAWIVVCSPGKHASRR